MVKMMYASCACSELVNKRDKQRIYVDFVNQTSHPFKNSVIQQTSSPPIKFNIISITFSTTYFLHPRLPYSATISGGDHILSCFRNTVDTLWTPTSSLEYYTKTFIDAIMKLYTYTESRTNCYYTASFIIVVLAFCQALSLNDFVMYVMLHDL